MTMKNIASFLQTTNRNGFNSTFSIHFAMFLRFWFGSARAQRERYTMQQVVVYHSSRNTFHILSHCIVCWRWKAAVGFNCCISSRGSCHVTSIQHPMNYYRMSFILQPLQYTPRILQRGNNNLNVLRFIFACFTDFLFFYYIENQFYVNRRIFWLMKMHKTFSISHFKEIITRVMILNQ